MEYNIPSDLVKDIKFEDDAKSRVIDGVNKLADAVESTLGSSGKCVIYEDGQGKPVITKDGVTVANSVILLDTIENMGASLIKEAARNTVREAGDGTTTATVIARELLIRINDALSPKPVTWLGKFLAWLGIRKLPKGALRAIKEGVEDGLDIIFASLKKQSIKVKGKMLKSVASISCNNDAFLGGVIGGAFEKVGNDGVVLIEQSETNETYSEIIDGVSFDCGYKSPYFMTDRIKGIAELDNPAVMIMKSKLPNLRRVLKILEYLDKHNKSLLIVGEVEDAAFKALLTNKVKGNIKVCVVDLPGFGRVKDDAIADLAMLTGAKVIDEDLGDDIDMIDESYLGEVNKSITDEKSTVLTIDEKPEGIEERINDVHKLISEEANGFIKKKLEERLSMLSGKVGVIYVGADSDVELKEKQDRVDDAVHATKAALNGGIIPGGGVAFKDASRLLDLSNPGHKALFIAINKPMAVIASNAGLPHNGAAYADGFGLNAVDGTVVDMVKANIVDPYLVAESALRNAASVALTIASTNAVISNIRA